MLKSWVGLLLLANLGLLTLHTGWLDGLIARSGGSAQREPDRLAQQIRVPQVTLLKADGRALDALSPTALARTSAAAASAEARAPAAASAAASAATSESASRALAAATAAPGPTAVASAAMAAANAALAVASAALPVAATASAAPAPLVSPPALPPASASAAALSALACLEAGPFDAATVTPAEQALRQAGLAPGSWVAHDADPGARFMIYMGRYASRETLKRKQDEIKRLGLTADEVQGAPSLQPGLNLGRFESQAGADAALAALALRGIHTAQVVALKQSLRHTLLRVPATDAALRQRLASLALPGGRPFTLCPEVVGRLAATSLPPPAAATPAVR